MADGNYRQRPRQLETFDGGNLDAGHGGSHRRIYCDIYQRARDLELARDIVTTGFYDGSVNGLVIGNLGTASGCP